MANEQTIEAVMGCVYEAYKVSRYRSIAGSDKFEAANAVVISAIAAALAAKDVEIERLKAKLTDHAKPEPGEWIEWNDGECPIADGVKHQVRFRDHSLSHVCDDAASWSWRHACEDFDIAAYRVLP